MCAVAGFAYPGVQNSAAQIPTPQDRGRLQAAEMEDSDELAGPFTIGGQAYSVVFHHKRLPIASDPAPAQTLAGVEIRDATGNVSYRTTFSLETQQGHLQRSLSATAQLTSGKTGAGIIIHYLEQTAASPAGRPQHAESWQVFGLVNRKLALLGKPSPIGEGMGGGPYMGVIMRAADGSVSVVHEPDTFEVRAWAGNFYAFVPLLVDWSNGGLAQGQRCMEMMGGGLQEIGCDMRVEIPRVLPAEEYGFLRMFVEANEKMGSAEHLVVQKDSKIEVLGCRSIITWKENGELIQPLFSDVWLHVRIGARDGWIHGEADFAAIGLHAGNPAP